MKFILKIVLTLFWSSNTFGLQIFVQPPTPRLITLDVEPADSI
ncbi:MAG: hypothetical protein ABJK28_04500 [Algibacter sp.]